MENRNSFSNEEREKRGQSDTRTLQTRMSFDPTEQGRYDQPGRAADASHPAFPESNMMRDTTGMHSGKGPRNYRRSDESILDEVARKLTDDPYIDASEIDLRVSDGELILIGTVDSREAKRRAEDIVDSVRGLSHFENRLRIDARDQ